MVCAEKIKYSSRTFSYIPCARFDRLRRLGKFIDLEIVTKKGHKVPAHRLVLTAQFPHIETAVTECTRATLEWRR
uniref:BTB domain-containing protein n=1 Tax=Mesocestoides corti TaxID=53468 RepID=A0A5K3FQ44_MESCO